jgi:hypothetical protein
VVIGDFLKLPILAYRAYIGRATAGPRGQG